MSLPLYELDNLLRNAINEAEAKIDPETGDIPEDYANFLDGLQMQRDAKCLGVAAYIRECKAEHEAIKAEAKRLVGRANMAANKADRLKKYLTNYLHEGEKLQEEKFAPISVDYYKDYPARKKSFIQSMYDKFLGR